MKLWWIPVVMLGLSLAGQAQAEMSRVIDRGAFEDLVTGKVLAYPLVRLRVAPDGTISGRGVRWDVTGTWDWQDGYFCREMDWGGSLIPFNCQEVRSDGRRIRFTTDRGAGDTAVFRIR